MAKRLLLVLTLILTSLLAIGQNLRGKVTNADGDPVAYVRVLVPEQSKGALTDERGNYNLTLSAGTHEVVFNHLNYSEHKVAVTLPEDRVVDVILLPKDLNLDPVEIAGGRRDPAYAIMTELIDHRRERLRQYESYTCQTYLKVVLQTDTLRDEPLPDSLQHLDTTHLVHLIESYSKTHFQQPGKYKSIVEAYRHYNPGKSQSVGNSLDGIGSQYSTELNNPYLFYLDVSQAEFNFYDNYINLPNLSDRPLVSPLNGAIWQVIYAFKLEERFYLNDKVHYRIRVTPRNKVGPYFSGEIIVVDGDWAIREAHLKVMPSTLNFFAEFRLDHQYQRTSDGRWLLTHEDYNYEVHDRKVRSVGQSTAQHTEYELDLEFPNRFFNNELRSTDREAFERDSSFWESTRPQPLGKSETAFIQVQDSIIEYRSSDEFLRKMDSADNMITWLDVLAEGITYKDRRRGMYYFFSPLLDQMQFAGVGGYRHQLRVGATKVFERKTQLAVRGRVDYGFANQDIKGEGIIRYMYNPRRFSSFYIRGGDVYSMVTANTTITAILARSNFVRKTYFGAGYSTELFNGFYVDLGIDYADRNSIDSLKLASWTSELFGEFNTPEEFDPYREFLFELKIRYTPGQRYFMEPYRKIVEGSRWPTFTLEYKKAIPGIAGSEIDFDYLALEAEDEFRIGSMGTSRWRAKAGRFLRAPNMMFTDEVFFRGSDPIIFVNPLNLFQLLGPTIRTRNAYFAGHYLHNFSGALMNKIPLINRTNLETTAGAATLLIEDGGFWHTEVFAGLQHPIRIRRVLFKVGVFYTTSYSNYAGALSGEFKVGVSFFDSSKNRWTY